MATEGFRPAFNIPSVPVLEYAEHATAGSFKKYDLIELNGGKVRLNSDDQAIFGVALKDASGTADTAIPCYVLSSDQIWVAEVDATVAVTNVGVQYGLNIGTAGSMSVDLGDTTTESVTIIGLDGTNAYGASGTKVLVKFLNVVIVSEQD